MNILAVAANTFIQARSAEHQKDSVLMRIVITGALGHIGAYLLHHLPEQIPGCEIVLIDNLMTQRYPSLFNLPQGANFRFIEGDVTTLELEPLFRGAEAVVHLAAITDAVSSFERAEFVEQNNLEGTRRIAMVCAKLGIGFIMPSSTSVYGVQNTLVDENCAPENLKPQSPYARVKLKEEALLAELGQRHNLRFIICRFGTIFGVSPGMRFHTAVNKFCWQAVFGQPITIWTTAFDQKRPYLDLVDAARSIVFILKRELFDGRTYNIVTLNATPRNIVDAIREFIPELTVTSVDSPIMNQLSYEVDNRRFRKLGFVFRGDLQRGLRETIALLRGANTMVTPHASGLNSARTALGAIGSNN